MSKLPQNKKNPTQIAMVFCKEDEPHLIRQNEDWLNYEQATGTYQQIEDEVFTRKVREFFKRHRTVAMAKDIAEVEKAVIGEVVRPAKTFSPPCWLREPCAELPDPDPHNVIVCKNGLLDFPTGKLHPHTPDFFTRNTVPIEWDPNAPSPKVFLKYLTEAMAERQHLVEYVQEIVGYLVSTDNDLEAVVYFLGKSRGGKGTLEKVIRALVGEGNVQSYQMASFGDKHWGAPLVGKSLLVIPDMNVQRDFGGAVNSINMISGRDPVPIRRLYKQAYNATLTCRVLALGAVLPNFGVHTQELVNRLRVVPFDVYFGDRQDTTLAARIIASELPGILVWALEGYKRLRARGKFLEPEESKARKDDLLHQASVVRRFVETKCRLHPDAQYPKAALYKAFVDFCDETGTRLYPEFNDFCQKLYELQGYNIGQARPRVGDGPRERCFTGIEYTGVRVRDGFDFKKTLDEELQFYGAETAIERTKAAEQRALFGGAF